MDLVDSVTQNSNNRNVTMENHGGSGGDDDNGGPRGGARNFGQSGHSQEATTTTTTTDEHHRQEVTTSSYQMSAAAAAGQHQAEEGSASRLTHSDGGGGGGSGSGSGGDEPARRPPQVAAAAPRSQVPDYLKAIGMDPRKFWPKKYRFTREKSPGQHNPLSIAQRNFYENNGYIVLDDCVARKLLEAIRSQRAEAALVSEFLVHKLVAKNDKLLQYAKCFCDERLMLMTHRLVESLQTGASVRELIDNNVQVPSQQIFRDWLYLPFRPIDKVCCSIVALEPLEQALLVVPGTHRVGQCTISSTLENISAAYDSSQEKSAQLREIFECQPERLSDLVAKSKRGFKYVNLRPGQTLFYHPGLIHGFSSDLVNFGRSQLAVIAYYAAADCEYIDLRQSPELISPASELPLSLAHFGDKNPKDYTSWIDKPILLKDQKSANL